MHFPILRLWDDDTAHILLVLIAADSVRVHGHLLLLQFVGEISKPVFGSICPGKRRPLFTRNGRPSRPDSTILFVPSPAVAEL